MERTNSTCHRVYAATKWRCNNALARPDAWCRTVHSTTRTSGEVDGLQCHQVLCTTIAKDVAHRIELTSNFCASLSILDKRADNCAAVSVFTSLSSAATAFGSLPSPPPWAGVPDSAPFSICLFSSLIWFKFWIFLSRTSVFCCNNFSCSDCNCVCCRNCTTSAWRTIPQIPSATAAMLG